jgi:DNA/RNA endonuclease G (NUC1)
MPISRWATHSAAFCLGAAAAVAATQTILKSERKSNTSSVDSSTSQIVPTKTSIDPSDQIKMMPSLPVRIYQPNPNLLIAFDTRTKNSAFVMEHLTSKSSNANGKASRKNKRFYEEQSLPPYFRSRAHHYKNSGYDRGHLAPAADFPSEDEMEDTFCLTNVSPQYAKLNRGMWLRLEDFVRDVVKSTDENKEVWVVTGPLWLPNTIKRSASGEDQFGYTYNGIGKVPSLVSVPSHFFKVIVVVDKSKSPQDDQSIGLKKFAAFVLPNDDVSEKDRDCLMNYAVRIIDLEAVSGLEFFPNLMGSFVSNNSDDVPLDKVVADALTDDLRYNAYKSQKIKQSTGESNALVPMSNNDEFSKGRLRKIKQILCDNAPLHWQHLCKDNSVCYKLFSV